MNPKSILVVDDEFYNAEVLAFALETEGYRVLCASNGRDALEKLRMTAVDLVVLDMMMPIMNGAEVARGMRADSALADIPIVITSALPEVSVRRMCEDFDAYLRKPFLIRDAMERVRRMLASQDAANRDAAGPDVAGLHVTAPDIPGTQAAGPDIGPPSSRTGSTTLRASPTADGSQTATPPEDPSGPGPDRPAS